MTAEVKAIIRRLRCGVVPGMALDQLSVGVDGVRTSLATRLRDLADGNAPKCLLVKGEWGTGKSHILRLIRQQCQQSTIPVTIADTNAWSRALNFPQRLYPALVENLTLGTAGPGFRHVMESSLPMRRSAFDRFKWSALASDLGPALAIVVDHLSNPLIEGSWCWDTISGIDIVWSDYQYKKKRALDRIEALGWLFRSIGLGGLVLMLDEVETIDQLWNIRSRAGAYAVLGSLLNMKPVLTIMAVSQRFDRVIEQDIHNGIFARQWLTLPARQFLHRWQRDEHEVAEPPRFNVPMARVLAHRVAALYTSAYGVTCTQNALNDTIRKWSKEPFRNPRSLIRGVVNELDVRGQPGPVSEAKSNEPATANKAAAGLMAPSSKPNARPVPYEQWQVKHLPDPRTAAQDLVQRGLVEIIAAEGPMPAIRAYQLYAKSFGASRVRSELKKGFNRALYQGVQAGHLEGENELGEEGLLQMIVRVSGSPRVRPRPLGPRTIIEVPPSEIAWVMEQELSRNPDISTDDLAYTTISHYGLKRLHESTRSRLLLIKQHFGL